MLFDERDLRIFESTYSREYFKEILQSYYNKNYRATVVLLYSFVVYDLLLKLKTMADEGYKEAQRKLKEIEELMEDDEKYSKVEKMIVDYFNEKYALYFKKFSEDIKYLKEIRHKCAHFNLNVNEMFVPKDYQVRMLICSMYDNIFSVRAPFVMDLFNVVESEIEDYSEYITDISKKGLDNSIKNTIKEKYLKRMMHDSIKKSYKTFIKLLLLSEDEECIKNIYGLYAFVYTMTDYIIENGHISILNSEEIIDIFSKLDFEKIKDSKDRIDALVVLMEKFHIINDTIRSYNNEFFKRLSDDIMSKPQNLYLYRLFYPREENSVYAFFKEKRQLQEAIYSETIYNCVKDSEDFDLVEYALIMVNSISDYYGFEEANSFMNFFKKHLDELDIEDIKEVMKVYNLNNQCTGRYRHEEDINIIKKYISKNFDLNKEDNNIEQ